MLWFLVAIFSSWEHLSSGPQQAWKPQFTLGWLSVSEGRLRRDLDKLPWLILHKTETGDKPQDSRLFKCLLLHINCLFSLANHCQLDNIIPYHPHFEEEENESSKKLHNLWRYIRVYFVPNICSCMLDVNFCASLLHSSGQVLFGSHIKWDTSLLFPEVWCFLLPFFSGGLSPGCYLSLWWVPNASYRLGPNPQSMN